MPTSETISEALYDACIRHECIRAGGFVEMMTHSATVNHGGGLWKQGEQVWANPCHYGRQMGMAQANGTPIGVVVHSDTIETETTFREITPVDGVPSIDVMATLSPDESEIVATFVNRKSTDESTHLTLEIPDIDTANEATLTRLSGETMYDANTRDDPERIVPESTTVTAGNGPLEFELVPYSLVRATVPLR
jgi:alpha-N-arabinofuranosidase